MTTSWDPSLTIGVMEIDAQHQEIFRHVDELVAAVARRSGGPQLSLLIEFLQRYVSTHFAAEEDLMRHFAFPGAAAHVAEHRKFTAEFQALRLRHEGEGATARLVEDVLAFAVAWLREHISRTDRAMGMFLQAATQS